MVSEPGSSDEWVELMLARHYRPLVALDEYRALRRVCGLKDWVDGEVVDATAGQPLPLFHVKPRLVGTNRREMRRQWCRRTMLRQEAHSAMTCDYCAHGKTCSNWVRCWSEPHCLTGEPSCGWPRLGRGSPRPGWVRRRRVSYPRAWMSAWLS